MQYRFEKFLVEDFVNNLPISPFAEFGPLKIAKEFEYTRGRTDVIAMTPRQEVIAFEMKLEKWRDALDQAFRNTCFSNYSYVVLPENVAIRAAKYDAEFFRRSVGICYVSKDIITVVRYAQRTEPLMEWLYHRATSRIIEGAKDDRND